MKTRLITFVSILLLAAIGSQDMSAQLAKGRKSLGVKTGYITLNKTATAGIELQYAFSRHFVLAPSIDYVFRNESMDGLMINLDYHGPWQLDRNGNGISITYSAQIMPHGAHILNMTLPPA